MAREMAPGLGPDTLAEIVSAAAAAVAAFVAVGQWIGVDFSSERRARQRYVEFLCEKVTRLQRQLDSLRNPKKDIASRRVRIDAAVLIAAIVSISFLSFFGYAFLTLAVAYAAVLALFLIRRSDLRELHREESKWEKSGDEIDAAIRETDRTKRDLKVKLIQEGILDRFEAPMEGIARLLGSVKVDNVAGCIAFSLLAAAFFLTTPTGPWAWLLLTFVVAMAGYGVYLLMRSVSGIYDYQASIQNGGYQVEALRASEIEGRVRLAEGGVRFGPETISITGIGRYFEYKTEGKYQASVPWKKVWSLEVVPELELPQESKAVPSA